MDFLFDFLFNSPIVPWAIGLVALYFVWNTVAPRLNVRLPGMSKDDLGTRFLGEKYAADKIEKQAARERKAANFLVARSRRLQRHRPSRRLDRGRQGARLDAGVGEPGMGIGEVGAEAGRHLEVPGDGREFCFAAAGRPGQARVAVIRVVVLGAERDRACEGRPRLVACLRRPAAGPPPREPGAGDG